MDARRFAPLLAFLVFFSLTACGGGDAPTGPGPSSPPPSAPPPPSPDRDDDGFLNEADGCPDAAETFNGVLDFDGCPDTTLEFYGLAKDVIELYWAQTFQLSGLQYAPITVFQEYTQPISIPCLPGMTFLNNAAYYPVNMGVYYDINFFDRWVDEIGDAAPAFIVAHEFGHHISHLLGFPASGLVNAKELELQADCFAGAFFAAADEAELLDEGDLLEIAEGLIRVGDPGLPWFSPEGHGTPLQRVLAADIGFTNGPDGCISADFFVLFETTRE